MRCEERFHVRQARVAPCGLQERPHLRKEAETRAKSIQKSTRGADGALLLAAAPGRPGVNAQADLRWDPSDLGQGLRDQGTLCHWKYDNAGD